MRHRQIEPAGHHHRALAEPENSEKDRQGEQRIEIVSAPGGAADEDQHQYVNHHQKHPGGNDQAQILPIIL